MQQDLFGSVQPEPQKGAGSGESLPVMTASGWRSPESLAFDAALKRGSLREALAVVSRLRGAVAWKVLQESGFTVPASFQRTSDLVAAIQADVIEAVQRRWSGRELRDWRAAQLAASPTMVVAEAPSPLVGSVGVESTEGDLHGSATVGESRGVSRRDGSGDRNDGADRGEYRESVDAGLAGSSEGVDRGAGFSSGAGESDESGEGSVGSASESGAFVSERVVTDARGAGGAAVDSVAGGVIEVPAVAPALSVVDDFVITDEDRIGLGGLAEKFRDNLAAVDVLRSMAAENRLASPDERRVLARYVGWGGLKGVFDPDNKQWQRQHAALRSRLSDDEWAAASRSQLDAFYTDPVICRAMFAAVSRMGFSGGRIIDPSVGTGRFFGTMPDEMRQASSLHGVELDQLTSQIAGALYPSARIAKATGFENYRVPAGYFDLVIGNPPFGSQPLTDDSSAVYSGWSIHNYFFAKSIEMLRPGGVMTMVVSHSFLDKLDPHVRQWIAHRAELVSGVRLPKTAFKEGANTEVVTDILIFQRMNERESLGRSEAPEWLDTVEVPLENARTGESASVMVNAYFANHPERVLGLSATESSQFRANEYTVLPSPDVALSDQLSAWVASLPEGIYQPLERSAEELALAAVAEVPEGVKEGSFFVRDGQILQRLPDALGHMRAAEWPEKGEMSRKRMMGMIGLREALRQQMRLERTSLDDAVVEAHRVVLREQYEGFRKKFGYVNDQVNRRLFIDDTEAPLVQALEFDYEPPISEKRAEELGIEPRKSRAVPADILSRRVMFPPQEVETVKSAKDALLHSLNQFGRLNLGYMQRIFGASESEIVSELGDLVFHDPDDGWVTADEYLSGDVKAKLAVAERAARGDAAFARNVMALKGVIPRDKLPSEIFASLGAAWVPGDIYQAFAKEISGADLSWHYVRGTGQWLMSEVQGANFAKNSNEFGTSSLSALQILGMTMNSRSIEVKKSVEVAGKVRYVTDETATEAARQKLDKIRGHWDSWLWSDGARVERLTRLYNDRFNRVVERRYDGGHLSFPGMNPAIKLLAHQSNGVWRGLQDRNLLLDQVVGAGKTFQKVALAMEMRRMGIARKPLLAVPNHLTLQWRTEFYRLYPGANVLAATPDDFEKANRGKFFSKIVTGNWDAVIVGHSSLKKLGVPLEAETAILKEQFDEISEGIKALKRERGDRNIIRDMERIKATLEGKLKKQQEKAGKKDGVVDFADLGIDAIFVDELHEFKNLFFTTQMSRVAGLGNPAGSGKAFDLFVKIRWLKETFGDKAPLITATGTPVSNSLAEMYTMQRFMQYGTLKQDDLHLFDAWAKQYGDVQTVYEVAPSGNGYRLSERFAKFKNLGSLMGSYRSFADVVTLDDLKAQEIARGKTFPVPKIAGGRPTNVVAKRSPAQAAFFGVPEIVRDQEGRPVFELDVAKPFVLERKENGRWVLSAENVGKGFDTEEDARFGVVAAATTPKMTVDPKSIVGQFENLRELTRQSKGKINALSLTGLASKAGLDYRLINPAAPDFAGSKINLAIDNMVMLHREWAADRGTQLIFCDSSVPASARVSMAKAERRVFVRDGEGRIVHRRGTLHTLDGFDGLPYFVVQEGKGKERSFSLFDPMTGQCMKDGLDSKAAAHEFVRDFAAKSDGVEQWLALRDSVAVIEPEDLIDYKNDHGLGDDAESADQEFTAQDIDGVSGARNFSVYDDIRAKLIARGVPPHEIEFIHDHDKPQAKALLYKRVNAGEVRFLLGSTPKLGAGTNVQERLVALHHIDAPWRPSDLEQREGRIIRRGNCLYERDPDRFEVSIFRYATEQTYDTRRWQLLEHKASGVEQLRKYNGANEVEDVASEAANSADMKAAASGNPLILRETQLANEVKKLQLQERAHRDNEFMLRQQVMSRERYAAKEGPELLRSLEDYVKAAAMVEAGQAPLARFGGRALGDKEAVQATIKLMDMELLAMGTRKVLEYKGVRFHFEREHPEVIVLTTADGGRTALEQLSPTGLVTRMDNWIGRLDERIETVRNRIEVAEQECVELRQAMGKPFEQAALLQETIAEHGRVQRALVKANASAAVRAEDRAEFDLAVGRQREVLLSLGYGPELALLDGPEWNLTRGVVDGEREVGRGGR